MKSIFKLGRKAVDEGMGFDSALPESMPAHWQENYLGLWAIEENFLRHTISALGTVDIPVHIQLSSEAIVAELEKIQGGYDVEVNDGMALVKIVGATSKHYNSFTRSTSTLMMRKTLRALRRDDGILGVVLHIDSPGGAVAGQKAFADEVAALAEEKPVYAFIEDTGASAAYWTASQATRIYANDMALVGSIGTYGVISDYSEMAEKAGIKVNVVRAGAMKGAGVPGTPVTDKHLAKFQREVDVMNSFFIAAISAGRAMSIEQVDKLATGDVWIGAEALAVGLVDAIGTLDDVMLALRNVIGRPDRFNIVAEMPKGDDIVSEQQVVVDADDDRVTALEAQLAQAELDKQEVAAQVTKLEKDAQLGRFDALIGTGATAWAGERPLHVDMLTLLADTYGEDSASFQAYVRVQKALTAQLASSRLLEDVGVAWAGSLGAVAGQVEAKAKKLMADGGLTYEQAYVRVLEQNPGLYQAIQTGE